MAHLISHLADFTALRDREDLDRTIVTAVDEALVPLSVALYRTIASPDDRHWVSRATIERTTAPPAAGPGADKDASSPLADHPARAECFLNCRIVRTASPKPTTLFPIITSREVVGVLEVVSHQAIEDSQIALVSALLRLYGGFHDLLDHSERDPLTGLLNRQTFDASFMQRTARSASNSVEHNRRGTTREPCGVWLGVIDIDYFKKVNDNFGHLIGDEVLLLLSRILQTSFRIDDLLYRFGGEEFVVVLRDLTPQQALEAFERLRSKVEAYAFPQVGRVTVSVGVAKAVVHQTPSESFGRADKALYHAKSNGRNLVVNYEELELAGTASAAEINGGIELF